MATTLGATLGERVRETDVGGPLEIIEDGVSVWQATNNRLAVADTGAIQEYYLYDATGAMVARGDDDGVFEQFAYDGQHMIGPYEQGIAKWESSKWSTWATMFHDMTTSNVRSSRLSTT
ncbi:MAG: hypothetical protein R3E66_01155 [bacterium]